MYNFTTPTPRSPIGINDSIPKVIIGIQTSQLIPMADFGQAQVYWVDIDQVPLGNIVYTVFDRATNLGLASFAVRYGAATLVGNVLFAPMPRQEIELRYLILPPVPYCTGNPPPGQVTP